MVGGTESRVVGGTFIGKVADRGQSIVMGEDGIVLEDGFQNGSRSRCFQRPVELRRHIGGSDMDAMIGGVGAG